MLRCLAETDGDLAEAVDVPFLGSLLRIAVVVQLASEEQVRPWLAAGTIERGTRHVGPQLFDEAPWITPESKGRASRQELAS